MTPKSSVIGHRSSDDRAAAFAPAIAALTEELAELDRRAADLRDAIERLRGYAGAAVAVPAHAKPRAAAAPARGPRPRVPSGHSPRAGNRATEATSTRGAGRVRAAWSPADLDELRRRWAADEPAAAIAAAMGRPLHRIKNKTRGLKLPSHIHLRGRRRPAAVARPRRACAPAQRERGEPKFAAETEKSTDETAAPDAELERLWRADVATREIAAAAGVTESAIRQRAKARGLPPRPHLKGWPRKAGLAALTRRRSGKDESSVTARSRSAASDSDAAQVAAAVAAGKVTQCPPAAAAPINNGAGFDAAALRQAQGEGALPHVEAGSDGGWRKQRDRVQKARRAGNSRAAARAIEREKA